MGYDYDVAVIGSGVGGLCTGALLAKRGYKTLLVEGLERWGGRWSTVEQEGFKLPTGAILMHRDGPLEKVFKEVNARFEVVNLPPTLHCRIEGKDYPMSLHNPLTLIDIASSMEMTRSKLVKLGGGLAKEIAKQKVFSVFKKSFQDPLSEGSSLTFREWLLQYTDNEVLHKVFDAIIVAVLTCHSWELPAAQFFQYMTGLGALTDAGLAPQGNLSLANELIKVIRYNGDAWENCPAKQIIVEKGAARGIVVEKEGKDIEIRSKVVINDSGPKKTVELAGSDNFSDSYLRDIRMRLRAGPAVLLLVASEKSILPEGAQFMVISGARRLVCGGELANLCPGLAPSGKYLSYFCGYPISSLVPMETEWEVAQCKKDLEEQFPDITRYGKILKIGIHDVDSDFPGARAWPGYDMPSTTSIKNLYNVGEGVQAPGWSGTNKAAETARQVAGAVSKTINI